MPRRWAAADLEHLAARPELEIAAPAAESGWRLPTPIWMVVVDGRLHVRTWQRRETGWYGHAVARSRARIRLPGGDVEVIVTPVGETDAASIDAAYREKYGVAAARSMVDDEPRRSTLRLDPAA